jgi:hypothetical protein
MPDALRLGGADIGKCAASVSLFIAELLGLCCSRAFSKEIPMSRYLNDPADAWDSKSTC